MMRRIWIAAVLALVLVVGTVGYALGSIPSADGRIHGCYLGTSDNKMFQLLDNDSHDGQCPIGWTEVSWAAD